MCICFKIERGYFSFLSKKVFKLFNLEYGKGTNDDKYNRLINAIIAKRHFYEKKERKN